MTGIRLRRARQSDAAWLNTWLPGVAASVGYDEAARAGTDRSSDLSDPSNNDGAGPGDATDRVRRAALGRLDDTHIITHAGDRVGVIIARETGGGSAKQQPQNTRHQFAIIELVATPPEHARRGYGLHAAALLEDQLRRRGIGGVYAPAPASHGIAMYFWIRLGYRPLLRPAWPCAVDGVAWLSRDLSKPSKDASRPTQRTDRSG